MGITAYPPLPQTVGVVNQGDPGSLAWPMTNEPIEAYVERTGTWLGKPARIDKVLGRRSLGWTGTSALEDCANYLNTTQAMMNSVVLATTYYIVSTNANDTNAAGTGARKVRIVYLDAAGAQQTLVANLNGVGAVSIGNAIAYIQWMEVSEVGSGAVAAVDIAIGTVNGAQTVASTVEKIAAGGNRSLSGRYKVPTGYSAYMIRWSGSAISANMDARLRATCFSDDRSLSTVFHFMSTMYLSSGSSFQKELDWQKLPAECELKVSCIAASAPAGNRLDANVHLMVVQN